ASLPERIVRTKYIITVLLLFASVFCYAQDSVTQADIDTLSAKIDTVVSRQDSLASNVDDLKDSVLAQAITSSFSKSLEEAMAHPDKLYEHSFKQHIVLSIITFIFLVLFLYFSFYYLRNSPLCRDEAYNADYSLKEVERRPYSYGRVQLFWWTIIILSCYILFFALYGVLLPLNSTIILLMGSGLAVFIFGKSMDHNQIRKNDDGQPARHQDLFDSEGFLTDILSDESGISIHRLQAVAFNIIFGIGFIGAFFSAISDHKIHPVYPFLEFEPWQLSLLGISSLGYLGLKSSENSTATKMERMTTARKEGRMRSALNRKPITTVEEPTEMEEPAVKRTDITD
ncbi:MAG: hypothetical protein WCF67_24575, partial [Chitinophagaceae bacterium]